MDLFVIIKRSITLFLIVLLCIYFFITYTSDTKQVTEIQNIPSSNLKIKNHAIYPKKIAKKEQITGDFKYQKSENTVKTDVVDISGEKYLSEAQLKDNRLISQFACSKKFLEEAHSKILNVPEEASTTKLPAELTLCKRHNKKYGFYTSISGGKTYSDNSEVFIGGIQAIGNRISYLIGESSYASFIKDMLTGEINSIGQFNGTINFQWLSDTSLGCYVGENGRIDFEIMYSKVNIEDDTPVFDKSAGIFAFLLNLYYNPSIKNTQFAPYVGLGIGPTIFRLKKINNLSQGFMPLNVPWFAYQAKLGIDYSVIQEMNIFLGYRYFSIPMPIADYIAIHNIEVGLRLNF